MKKTPVTTLEKQPVFAGLAPRGALVALVVWTLLGLSFALRSYGWSRQNDVDFPLWGYVVQTLTDFYLYALASPLVFRLGRRFPLEIGSLRTTLPLHALVSLAFTLAINTASVLAIRTLGLQVCTECPPVGALLVAYLSSPILLHQGLLAYWGMVLVGQGLKYYRDMRSEKLRVAQLSSQLAEAQLSALKMQIHPHFLFNTLNSIAALMPDDVPAAELMLTKLSNFLRMTLHSSGAPVVTLREEFHFLATYLEIEKVRFGERLHAEFACAESVLDARIPNLLLQPLVENSIRHGLSRRKSGGRLVIAARREGGRLVIEIADNGAARPAGGREMPGGGLGLKNTVGRLRQTYGDDYFFEIKHRPETGTGVRIELPFET